MCVFNDDYVCVFVGCEFGDLEVWCASIGKRYAASSCYDNEMTCCKTCALVKSNIPGQYQRLLRFVAGCAIYYHGRLLLMDR